MSDLCKKTNVNKASAIIKAKLEQAGGKASILSLTGKIYEVYAKADNTFYCDELESSPKYGYEVFDEIVDGALENGNELPKGDGRGKKFGEPGCDENTVVGRIAMHIGKKEGESVDDPVSVLVAILDWAGVAENNRGYIQLAEEFLKSLESERTSSDEDGEISLKLLEEKFKKELIEHAEECSRKYKYRPSYYLNMINREGAVATAKKLIRKSCELKFNEETLKGFEILVKNKDLDLSMEASVCKPEYAPLFTEEEIAYCKKVYQRK